MNALRCGLLVAATAAFIIHGTTCLPLIAQVSQDQTKAPHGRAFEGFTQNVNRYQKLRSQLEAQLPPLKTTDEPATLLAREQVLAARIVEQRKAAKRGDIFTDEIGAEFRRLIREAFSGPKGRDAYKTIYQGEPLNLSLRVNQRYPQAIPATTVPPTLLEELPKLPANLQYRIVGHDFVLEDVKANLVIDFIPGAFPMLAP
jgi:hypothetical protein